VKDQYVGDINDFLKYGLLRAVAGQGLQVGIIWMLTPSDTRADGRRLEYLATPERFRGLDPPLFDVLEEIVESGDRTVAAIERARVLPRAVFLSEVLTDGLEARESYFQQAWAAAEDSPVVFFDPDNGLEVRSVRKGRRNSSKYLYWDELQAGYRRGHSIVAYQHFPRRPRMPFLMELSRVAQVLLDCRRVLALTTAHVAFLVVPQADDAAMLSQRLGEFSTRAAPHAMALDLTKAGP
jgi:hypothetical protein